MNKKKELELKTKRAENLMEKINEDLDKQTKLSWMEKQSVKMLMKKIKKGIKKAKKKIEKDNKDEKEVRRRIVIAIMETTEIFDIEIELYNDKKEQVKDENGRTIIVKASKENLEKMPTEKLIGVLEDVVRESEEVTKDIKG